MKILIILSCLLFSLNAEFLHIGSWNIRWFGDKGKGKQKIENLVKYISKANLDLLAIQEVCDEKELRRLCLKLSNNGQRWQAVILSNRIPNDNSQRCAIIWNSRKIKQVGSAYKIPLHKKRGEKHIWHRHPHALKFSRGSGLSDFVFIPIHMKAYANKAAQRQRELQTLYASLHKVEKHFSDRDIIILGDTNLSNSEKLPSSNWRAINKKKLSTSPKSKFHSGSALDKIIVPVKQAETRSAKFYLHKTVNDYWHRKSLSDHFLIYTELKIMKDDD